MLFIIVTKFHDQRSKSLGHILYKLIDFNKIINNLQTKFKIYFICNILCVIQNLFPVLITLNFLTKFCFLLKFIEFKSTIVLRKIRFKSFMVCTTRP